MGTITTTINERFIRFYFDTVYNPAYDFLTARFTRYRHLQENCINKLHLETKGEVLCIGVGTGNEIARILKRYPHCEITAIDYSNTALRKANKRVGASKNNIQMYLMNAKNLEFPHQSFNSALCVHVLDFIDKPEVVLAEIIRVLKQNGEFVITFPSNNEGLGLGKSLFKGSVSNDIASGRNQLISYISAAIRLLMGIVYLPIYFRNGKKVFSKAELKSIFDLTEEAVEIEIEEEPVYRDFIVWGRKI